MTTPVPAVLRVRANEGLCRSPYFTHDHEYIATRVREDLRVYEVLDDRGRPRVILPGEPCPHFVMPFPIGELTLRGRFETVAVVEP